MAMIAGMNAHMGLCHAMVMPLCALYHIPHGQACGMTLPHVLAYNEEANEEKVTNIFRALEFVEAEADISVSRAESYQRLNELLTEVGIMARLSDFGYSEDHMQTIVHETFNSVQCQFNPRKTSEEDIIGIVKKMI
jgi:alcohol dehydrogenase